MKSLRTAEVREKYLEYLKTNNGVCLLCEQDSIKDFVHWKLTINKFPYNEIAETHHLLIPRRHTTERDLTEEELHELREIKEDFVNTAGYDCILENTMRAESIPDHFHLHFIVVLDRP